MATDWSAVPPATVCDGLMDELSNLVKTAGPATVAVIAAFGSPLATNMVPSTGSAATTRIDTEETS